MASSSSTPGKHFHSYQYFKLKYAGEKENLLICSDKLDVFIKIVQMWIAQISHEENLEMFPFLSDLDIKSNLSVQYNISMY